MDRSQLCGCKGVRTCLLCEKEFNLTPTVDSESLKVSKTKICFLLFIYLLTFYFLEII